MGKNNICYPDITKEQIEYLHWEKWLYLQEISKELNISTGHLRKLIKKFNIDTRKSGIKDLRGHKFGKLTIIKYSGCIGPVPGAYWLCRCDCGVEKNIVANNLITGTTKSCGNNLCNGMIKDITDQKFGTLTPIEYIKKPNKCDAYWLCRCDCGVEKIICAGDLKSGRVKTCSAPLCNGNAKNILGQSFNKLTVIKFDSYKEGARWVCKCECGNITNPIHTSNLMSNNTKSCGLCNVVSEDILSQSIKRLFNVEIVRHKKFEWLGKQHLDGCAYIGEKLLFAFEYDGEQHFKPVRFGNISQERAEDEFKKCINRDIKKNKLCKKNNVKLVRFSYKDKVKNIISDDIIIEKINKVLEDLNDKNKRTNRKRKR